MAKVVKVKYKNGTRTEHRNGRDQKMDKMQVLREVNNILQWEEDHPTDLGSQVEQIIIE